MGESLPMRKMQRDRRLFCMVRTQTAIASSSATRSRNKHTPPTAHLSISPHAHGRDLRTADNSRVTGPPGGWVRRMQASRSAWRKQESASGLPPEADPGSMAQAHYERVTRTTWIRRSGSKCRATSVRPGRKRRTGTTKRTHRRVSMGGASCFHADGVSVCACHCP